MKKLFNLILFVLLIGFLYLTCPNDSAHADALSEALSEYFSEHLGGIELDEELGDLKDNPAMQNVINALAPKLIDVDDYLLVSIGREKLSGNNNIVSFGIGGHVFTFNDEVVKRAVNLAKEVEEKVKEAATNRNR